MVKGAKPWHCFPPRAGYGKKALAPIMSKYCQWNNSSNMPR